MANDYEARYQQTHGIHIYRHPLCIQAKGLWGYLTEFASELFWQLLLAVRIFRRRGFDVIHACNPPDLIFLVAFLFIPFGVKLVFDHHDMCPDF